jgi:hypothetical protein
MKLFASALLLFLGSALSVQDVSVLNSVHKVNLDLDLESEAAMKAFFERSEEAHQASMSEMMKTMTVEKAVAVLQQKHVGHEKELVKVASLVKKGKSSLRQQPTGYEAVDGARDMLNQMIYEAFVGYDREIMECVDFYYQHCAQMEVCRGEIAGANFIAANSRALILDAQTTINMLIIFIINGEKIC